MNIRIHYTCRFSSFNNVRWFKIINQGIYLATNNFTFEECKFLGIILQKNINLKLML